MLESWKSIKVKDRANTGKLRIYVNLQLVILV